MFVLLVEDDRDLAANLCEFLEARGHRTDYAADGLQARQLCEAGNYDLIILDVGLPGSSGLDVCRWLRNVSRSNVPVLMLTARDLETDLVAGFEAGADDYLRKPFSLAELAARINALGRRGRHGPGVLQIADLELDPAARTARRGAVRLALTPSGLRILELLMRASPGVVSREEVVDLLWGDTPPSSDAALRAHIHQLRHAVDLPGTARLVHTVHGIGYRLGPDPDAA